MSDWIKDIEHVSGANSGGSFTGGGWKALLHTTEGGTRASDVVRTLRAKNAWVHFVFNPYAPFRETIQCLPLDVSARGLQHPVGTLQTNRANAIQIEMVGFAQEATARQFDYDPKWAVENWGDLQYGRLAHLLARIKHNVPYHLQVRGFQHPRKFSQQGFVDFSGICGHVHVPGNSHVDPGPLRGGHLLNVLQERLHS